MTLTLDDIAFADSQISRLEKASSRWVRWRWVCLCCGSGLFCVAYYLLSLSRMLRSLSLQLGLQTPDGPVFTVYGMVTTQAGLTRRIVWADIGVGASLVLAMVMLFVTYRCWNRHKMNHLAAWSLRALVQGSGKSTSASNRLAGD